MFANEGIPQNLVPNPSFEEYTDCPYDGSGSGQLYFAIPWYSPSQGSPDYFNSCDVTNVLSVPDNVLGYEYARTGKGYAGFFSFYIWGLSREYIQVELLQPLIYNINYCVNFYLSLADTTNYAVNNIGAYLSANLISSSNDSNFPNTPQILNNSLNPLTSKINWIKISGTFMAAGGEKYITIGNFNNDANSDTIKVGLNGWNVTYYYIDDVSVYPCDAPVYTAEAGDNTTICKDDSIQLGTTPRDEYIYWWLPASGLNNDSIANPKAGPQTTTTYYLHQKDFKFDETIDSVTVYVEECGYSINAPNAFTPNSDGVNDIFKAHGKNIKEIHGKIFNRWGEELFEWSGVNEGWNGKYNGQDVSAGAYFYVIRVVYMNGKMEIKKGSIEVIR